MKREKFVHLLDAIIKAKMPEQDRVIILGALSTYIAEVLKTIKLN